MTTKKTAKKQVTKKPAAKPAAKTATKKVVKKTAAKPAPKKVTKPAAKKSAPAKTTAAKKPAAQKSAAKKIVVTKKPAVKAAAKAAAKTAAKAAPKAAPKSTVPDNIRAMAKAVEKALDMNKAKDIIAVDLSRKSALADYMIVATGGSSRQVAALARYAEEAMHKAGAKRCRIEGLPQGDWVIVDCGDIVVHLFRPEVREFYQLEKLWTDEPGTANSRRSLA